MNQQQVPMILGGSLPQVIRAGRSELRGAIAPKGSEPFQKVLNRQTQEEVQSSPVQAVAGSVYNHALAGLTRLLDDGNESVHSDSTKQSIKSMVNAIRNEIAVQQNDAKTPSRTAIVRQNSPLLPLGPMPAGAKSLAELVSGKSLPPVAGRAGHTNAALAQAEQSGAAELGKLSAQFESGKDGIAAIGYDKRGGTSYGKYQIASKPGSMDNFIQFLQTEAPDIAKKLQAAGPANTGSRQGRMPEVWRAIAAAEPERFGNLQEGFIRESHYKPAIEAVKKAGFHTENFSPALQEVLFSTAVQHGPNGAARIFTRAAEQVGLKPGVPHETTFIKEVYAKRAGQFENHTAEVRSAVHNRLHQEKNMAIAMVQNPLATA